MSAEDLPPIVGDSPAIRDAVATMRRFALSKLPILLVGATGTGKDLFARHIHQLSGRSGQLVDVNCGALPREMVESLLFGHRRGAFTGAIASSVGHVERSSGGTLFLDELTDLPFDAQVKLLRVLETEDVLPLGAAAKRRADLRVVAAVQDDISIRLENGTFRRDLYRRIAGAVIELPPLAQRRRDILPLAQYFAACHGRVLEQEAQAVLAMHSWPDNVRELRLAIERAGYLVEDGTLSGDAVREAIRLGTPCSHPITVVGDGRDRILRTCSECGWHATHAARRLNISRTTLRARLKEMGIVLREQKKLALHVSHGNGQLVSIGLTNADQC
ncbi:MAG: sigma 54-interacting transcriptional regulator [Gemmatimonadales bacterium]